MATCDLRLHVSPRGSCHRRRGSRDERGSKVSQGHGMSAAMPAQSRFTLRVNFSPGGWAAAAANVPQLRRQLGRDVLPGREAGRGAVAARWRRRGAREGLPGRRTRRRGLSRRELAPPGRSKDCKQEPPARARRARTRAGGVVRPGERPRAGRLLRVHPRGTRLGPVPYGPAPGPRSATAAAYDDVLAGRARRPPGPERRVAGIPASPPGHRRRRHGVISGLRPPR